MKFQHLVQLVLSEIRRGAKDGRPFFFNRQHLPHAAAGFGIVMALCVCASVYPQNELTRVYGPEDHAVPTPSLISAIGQQDASALKEITEYRTVINAAAWTGFQAAGIFKDNLDNLDQATLTVLGNDQFRLDVSTPSGVQSTRINGIFGFEVTADGKTRRSIPPVTARGGLFAFPRLIAPSFPDPATVIVDRGEVQLDGAVLHRITVETPAVPSQSAIGQIDLARNLNLTDLYFDPASHLLIKSASLVQLNTADRARYLVVITYSDYQTVGGILLPFNFVQTTNGQRQWVLQLGSPNLQPDVTTSYFHF